MQDNELSLPVEDFAGIDRNVDREDLTPRHFYSLKNLWENNVGVLETRGGSIDPLPPNTIPSTIGSIRGAERLYRGTSESYRVMAVHASSLSVLYTTPPSWLTASWDGAGYGWGNSIVPGNLNTICYKVTARVVGYGISLAHDVLLTAPASGNRLKVSITGGSFPIGMTGIEIYAWVNIASSGAIAERRRPIWVGYIDCTPGTTFVGDHYFTYGPLAHDFTAGAADWNPSAVSFTVSSYNDGVGQLLPGKTYYVLALVQHLKSATGTDVERLCYHAPNVAMTTVVPITIRGDHNAIKVNPASGTRVLICLGEHRQLLQPIGLATTSTDFNITKIPAGIPGVVDIEPVSASNYTFTFRESDFSLREMLCHWNGSVLKPIFISRLNYYANKDIGFGGVIPKVFGPANNSIGNFGAYDFLHHTSLYDSSASGFRATRYDFEQYENFLYFTNDFDPKVREIEVSPGLVNRHSSGTNYYMCGGLVAAAVIEEDYKSSLIRLPAVRKISKFQESILLTAGEPAVDLFTASRSDSSRSIYFSRAFNPFNFTVAGAGSPTYQFFSVELGGEQITGVGTFSITTSDSGPQAQLVIGKRSSFWMMNSLPATISGALEQVYLANVTRKAGCVSHRTFVNSPIGLLVAAFDNVYLIRDTGEPSPIGDPVRPFIKSGDLTNAFAVFHDGQYKLSFYHPDYPGTAGLNNVELWLDVNKVKLGQGAPDWKGPMVGRTIDYSFIEDLAGDGDIYNESRDRYCVDMEGKRLFLTDVAPGSGDTIVYDFAIPIEVELETKDFEYSPQDNNWNKLIKRTYWKARVANFALALSATEKTYIDGVLYETKPMSLTGIAAVAFENQPLRLNPVFPTGRPRGRTVRKVLTTTGRIGIGGFAINYQIERRRI